MEVLMKFWTDSLDRCRGPEEVTERHKRGEKSVVENLIRKRLDTQVGKEVGTNSGFMRAQIHRYLICRKFIQNPGQIALLQN